MASDFGSWQKSVDARLDRILNELDFVKNRTAVYLGRNEALTWLADDTAIFVNTDDSGCPINFLNGGRYEEENFAVLFSYRRPDSVFLDIGANLGVFTLRLAPCLSQGRIMAFEPQARMRELFARSVFLNGYRDTGRVTIQPWAISDSEGEAVLYIPAEHAGGGSLEAGAEAGGERVLLRRLDDQVPENFQCSLVKLDVEGHELHALRGMRQVLARSPRAVVLFEKLSPNSGIEAGVMEFGEALGWTIYALRGTALQPQTQEQFRNQGGYFLAGQAAEVTAGGTNRNFFNIYPADLHIVRGGVRDGRLVVTGPFESGAVHFHGPYWFLPRGFYRLTLVGEVEGRFQLDIQERVGFKLGGFEVHPGQMSVEISIPHDLVHFELVLRSRGGGSLALDRICLLKQS